MRAALLKRVDNKYVVTPERLDALAGIDALVQRDTTGELNAIRDLFT